MDFINETIQWVFALTCSTSTRIFCTCAIAWYFTGGLWLVKSWGEQFLDTDYALLENKEGPSRLYAAPIIWLLTPLYAPFVFYHYLCLVLVPKKVCKRFQELGKKQTNNFH